MSNVKTIRKRPATLKDVVERVGVSPTAVSLVLNNRPNKISEETKKRIFEAAEELDYQPNHAARSLATKTTNTIGVIIPDIGNAFFSEAVRTIQTELSKHNYDMLLCNSEEKFENDLKYLKLFANRNVDGVILTMSSESMNLENQKEINKVIETYKVPVVLFDRYIEGNQSKVFVDNLLGGYDVARHLLDNGHKNIGVITGPMNLNSSSDRLEGTIKAFKEEGLKVDERNIVQGNYDMETGREGARKLIGNVSAIFAFNDLQAYGVIEVAKSMGVRIPEDLSLVGFDDIFYSRILDTQLTTVRQPIVEMSKNLCDTLLSLMKEEKDIINIPMKAELVIRNSVRKLD